MVMALRPSAAAAAIIYAGLTSSLQASPTCPDEQPTAQLPQDLKFCKDLEPVVRNPEGLPLDQYEAKLGAYLGAFCHRNVEGGWRVDKGIRDTGPWVATYRDSASFKSTPMRRPENANRFRARPLTRPRIHPVRSPTLRLTARWPATAFHARPAIIWCSATRNRRPCKARHKTSAWMSGRPRSIRASPGSRKHLPEASWSARPTGSTGRSKTRRSNR